MTPQSELDRLRALLSAATPGPWRGGVITQGQPIAAEIMAEVEAQRGKTLGAITTEDGRFVALITSTEETIPEDLTNAHLIVALRNGADELLDEVVRLRGALESTASVCEYVLSKPDAYDPLFAQLVRAHLEEARAALHPKQERDDATG